MSEHDSPFWRLPMRVMDLALEDSHGSWLNRWTPEQVVDFMLAGIENGDFYILCPDNDVTREVDNKRMEWATGDLIHNRPPLSRWHPDHEAAFADFMKE